MRSRKLTVAGFFCLVLFFAALIGGRQAVAGSTTGPGTSSDPLATKSYVEKVTADRLGDLEKQVQDLQRQVDVLEQAVNYLERTINGAAPSGSDSSGSGSTGSVPGPAVHITGVVTTSAGANLRQGPDVSYERIMVLTQGTRVDVLEQSSGWCKVKTSSGTVGWVSADLLDISQ